MKNFKESIESNKLLEYVGTATAARMLNMSITHVQSLVDSRELHGWKTRGGHRRISMESIQAYQTHAHMEVSPRLHKQYMPRIMVAVTTNQLQHTLKECCATWKFPVHLTYASSVTEALLSLESERPDLLLVEMAMPASMLENTLQALEKFNSKGRTISIVLVTQEGELPPDRLQPTSLIQVVPGPLNESWIHGYLRGVVAVYKRVGM